MGSKKSFPPMKGDPGNDGADGDDGDDGANCTVSIGTVTTGAPGSSASVANVGTPSAAVLDIAIPRGNVGSTGSNGPAGAAATVAVGTVSTLASGSSATVANAGTSAAAVLNFGIPQGVQGIQGATGNTGATGAAGSAGNPGTPNSVSPVFGTAYQATDPTKAALISVMVETSYTVTIAGTSSDTVELRIGPNATTVANGTGGTAVATFKASLTGITLTIGLANINRNQLTALLPAGWYYAVRRVAGTVATIPAAFDQPL